MRAGSCARRVSSWRGCAGFAGPTEGRGRVSRRRLALAATLLGLPLAGAAGAVSPEPMTLFPIPSMERGIGGNVSPDLADTAS